MSPKRKTSNYKIIKRFFDVIFSLLALVFFGVLILILVVISAIDTNSVGVFKQKRVGFKGHHFIIFKIRTFPVGKHKTPSKFGIFLRYSKLDELPQLFNILKGDMSFVGPRPDVSGYADKLTGSNRLILTVRPGLTGPASIAFRNEATILKEKKNSKEYNDKVIWPKKVKLNIQYVQNISFKTDLYYLIKTII